ncbi:MAG TPA: TlpA disulfide reductase family protein [Kofleriaceae bacterium]
MISALVLATACHRESTHVPEGDVVASLTVPSLAGDQLDLNELSGKPAVILFVTPSCVHCLKTIPNAVAAAKRNASNIVAVFVAGDMQRAQRVVDQLKFPGPALEDDGTLRKLYSVEGVPYTLIVGRDGHAVDAFEGEQSEETLSDALAHAR